MLDGYRLVELDCYNGKGDSITITHGYTMAGEIELKDVLTQLRKTAFVNSDLPVILSIENHLDKSHQLVMVNLFKTILKDLYIFPSENPPDYLPSLSEMKNKFIIKTGGVRVIKDRTKITPRSQLSYVTEDDKKTFISKLHFVLQNIINDKEKSILTQRLNERNNANSTHIDNSVLDTLQRINLKKAQKLRINEHIILELKQRLKNINS